MPRGLLARLLITAAPTLAIVALTDRWLAATVRDRGEAVFAAVADPTLPLTDLVVGASHAAHGIDPRPLDRPGTTFWNLALDGAGPTYLGRWYAHFRRHRPAPDRVVLVVPWFVFKPGCLWRRWEHDAEYLDPRELADAALAAGPALPDLIVNRFPVLKHQRRLLVGFPPGLAEGATFRAERGFAPLRGRGWPWKPPGEYLTPDDPAEVAALAALLDALLADGAAVACVQVPTLGAVTPPHDASDAVVHRLAAARRVPLHTFEDDPIRNDAALYRDWSHLNEAGARRFSARLAARLAADDGGG